MACLDSWKLTIQVVSYVVCTLSALGSLLIILSYFCFKTLRSKTRLLLVNISIMDFGVGCSNLVGIAVGYERHIVNVSATDPVLDSGAERLCLAQAFFADWCTHASIIWTILLSVYIYLLITHSESLFTKYAFTAFYSIGYGLPLILSLWLLNTGRLGYTPYNFAGWCSIVGGDSEVYVTFIGYDLWIYLTFILVPVLSLSVHCNIREKLKQSKETGLSDKSFKVLYKVHYKFLAVPVVFVLLRVWTVIVSIVYIYAEVPTAQVPCSLFNLLALLSAIGDSGQGVANAVLYLLFTGSIRRSIFKLLVKFRSVQVNSPSRITI